MAPGPPPRRASGRSGPSPQSPDARAQRVTLIFLRFVWLPPKAPIKGIRTTWQQLKNHSGAETSVLVRGTLLLYYPLAGPRLENGEGERAPRARAETVPWRTGVSFQCCFESTPPR
eukprot:scaffold95841_cov52-Phaeocystis_antarctica.AAC.2